MTEAKANEIFRTKYPDGEICRRNSTSAENKYWVTFKPNSKVYYYSCTSYAELLNKLGFEVVYKHNIESAKATLERYEKELNEAKAGKFSKFAFIFTEQTPETEKYYINDLQAQVDQYKELVRHYTEDCIVD